MSLAGVILAAGFSRRLGRAKQTVLLGGETLLARTVRTAREASLDPVLLVLREADCSLPLAGVWHVLNAEAAEGMASSVRLGVRAAEEHGVEGVVLMTCDQPLLSARHLRHLCADANKPCASAYAGRRGVPAYFPKASFPDLLALTGDQGARPLLQGVAVVEDEDLALDIDTEDDVMQAESIFRRRGLGLDASRPVKTKPPPS